MPQGLIQRSFAGGEIAPALYGRADQVKYQTGLKILRNFQVLKHGGVANRSGTGFIAEVKTSALATYLIKFVFNADQTYRIEVGNLYFRFYRNRARIVIAAPAAYNGATTYAIADLVSYGGVNYYSRVAANVGNQPDVSPTQWYALTELIYEIPTPYATADLAALQFTQSGDIVTIVHPSYDPMELTRTGHTAWSLIASTFAPSIGAPGSVTSSDVGVGGDAYCVTAIKSESYEESLASSSTETASVATSGAPDTITWANVSGAQEYNVYKRKNGVFGFIGIAASGVTGFVDNGITPDMSLTPPVSRNPFSGANNRPSVVAYYQQRLMMANQNNNTEKIFGSRSGMFKNFSISSPLQDDDAVTFGIAGRQVNAVRHLVDLGTLVALTASAEYFIEGNQDGTLSATQPPNPRQIGANGASAIMPMIVNDSLVYAQARGSVIRDLRYEIQAQGQQAGYRGRDLTVFATHLFINQTISRMDYAQIPNSIAYIVRADGTMLGLTYLPEHEIWGWHRHDTDGTFEDVCVAPAGAVDEPYVIVKRTINGVVKRYIEYLPARDFTDIEVDAKFMDSHLTYDGRNTAATTVTLSTGAGWTIDDTITVTAAAGTPFIAGYVGDDVVVWSGTTEVSIRVVTFTSTTVVSGTPNMTVPVVLRSTALTTWGRAVDQVSGLDHLEAKNISAFGDGNVIANPNNDAYNTVTVTAGVATFDRPYLIIHAGLPYLADFQTLDLDISGQQLRERKKKITHIALLVESSRGIFAGPDFDTLNELQPEPITTYNQPWPLKTGVVDMSIAATWDESGSFAVRQKDPLPLTILSAIPIGEIGG